jgi:hypothetical protein
LTDNDGQNFLAGIVPKFIQHPVCVTGACRYDEITNLTMRNIEVSGSAILVKVQVTKNYKSWSFTILGKFYLETQVDNEKPVSKSKSKYDGLFFCDPLENNSSLFDEFVCKLGLSGTSGPF